jgi:hypothetical protein
VRVLELARVGALDGFVLLVLDLGLGVAGRGDRDGDFDIVVFSLDWAEPALGRTGSEARDGSQKWPPGLMRMSAQASGASDALDGAERGADAGCRSS